MEFLGAIQDRQGLSFNTGLFGRVFEAEIRVKVRQAQEKLCARAGPLGRLIQHL